MSRRIRVMVIDDIALVRDILAQGLALDPGIEIVGTAGDPFEAARKIPELKPDVLTLDVEMPLMDGVEFLRRLMPQYPLPVVMVSALTERGKQITLDALAAGAVDFVSKPGADLARGLTAMLMELRTKIKIASTVNASHWKNKNPMTGQAVTKSGANTLSEPTDKIIAIGASTGGTEAIREVITRFPSTTPGVLIVQHMPAGFTKVFSDRMNALCSMMVKEAEDGDRVLIGRILVAPGGKHMRVTHSGSMYTVEIKPGPLVNGHCPSVETMMQSVAENAGANAVGVMLTGMGGDGASGLKAMRDAGARTLAQDEATCVVFGMPKVAWEKGGVERFLPLPLIADNILRLINGK